MVIWTYTVSRKWLLKEARYDIVIDRSIEGEGRDQGRRTEQFDLFG